jgi:hypothetical protein
MSSAIFTSSGENVAAADGDEGGLEMVGDGMGVCARPDDGADGPHAANRKPTTRGATHRLPYADIDKVVAPGCGGG